MSYDDKDYDAAADDDYVTMTFMFDVLIYLVTIKNTCIVAQILI